MSYTKSQSLNILHNKFNTNCTLNTLKYEKSEVKLRICCTMYLYTYISSNLIIINSVQITWPKMLNIIKFDQSSNSQVKSSWTTTVSDKREIKSKNSSLCTRHVLHRRTIRRSQNISLKNFVTCNLLFFLLSPSPSLSLVFNFIILFYIWTKLCYYNIVVHAWNKIMWSMSQKRKRTMPKHVCIVLYVRHVPKTYNPELISLLYQI